MPALGAQSAGGTAGRLPLSISTWAASALVMKSMYAAATSGCLLPVVMAQANPTPPVVTGVSDPSGPSATNPPSAPRLLITLGCSQVPVMTKADLPLPKSARASSREMPLAPSVM